MNEAFVEAEHRLVAEIYQAAMEPSHWADVLRQIADVGGFSRVNLIMLDHLNPNFNQLLGFGTTQEEYDVYMRGGFADLDMDISRKWPNFQTPGTLLPNYVAFGSQANWVISAGRLYDEFYRFIDSEYHLGGSLEVGEFRWSILSMHRRKADPLFDDACIAFANRLAQHIRRALQIHRQFTFVRDQNAQLRELLDRLNTAVLLIDHQGQVRFANPRAERLISSTRALKVGLHGSLQACHEQEQLRLKHLLGRGGVTCLHSPDKSKQLKVTIAPLASLGEMVGFKEEMFAQALFLTDPAAKRRLSRSLLKELFALNERECDICELFFNRPVLEDVAASAGITLSSLRTYLREIYTKTGKHSQAELIQLLSGLTLDFEHLA